MNFLEEGFGVLLKFQKTWGKACSLPTLRMNTTSFLVKRSRDGQKNQEVQSGFSVPLDFFDICCLYYSDEILAILRDEILPSGETVAVILKLSLLVFPSVCMTFSCAENTT